MSQIPALISDLAVILISAGLVTLLFKKLKQPVVLGYIVAGILAGPSIEQIPTVTDVESIRIWADIGVIFLLFALGLDFSFKKLMKVGGTAVIGAITVVIGMMTAGYITGLSLGWGHMNSLFLGGMLSMSSTTIIFKAFDDMGLRNQRFAGVVFGILVVEDLFAVLLMVLLSTVAVSKHVEGMEMLDSVVKLGIFLLFCFVVGIYLIPSFLKKAKSFLNEETLLIVSIGLCLGMVMIATKAGFSSALGAFVMGSILAETIDAERIEHLVKPVKDLFGAIFFVSVGMLIDPQMLWEYKIPIFIITLVVMAGQICFASFGVLLSGQPISHPVWFLVSADRRIRLHHRRFGTIIKRDGSISVSDRCRRIRDHDILHTLYDPASGTYLQMGGADHTGELETVLGAIFIRFQYDPSKKRME